MPIKVPTGPGGHDRGKPELPPGSCYLCEAAAGRTEKPFVEETLRPLQNMHVCSVSRLLLYKAE